MLQVFEVSRYIGDVAVVVRTSKEQVKNKVTSELQCKNDNIALLCSTC